MTLSKYAHPITQKVWMTKKIVRGFYTNPYHDGGEAEVFEDGYVIIFKDGERVFATQHKGQIQAISFLQSRGWKISNGSVVETGRF